MWRLMAGNFIFTLEVLLFAVMGAAVFWVLFLLPYRCVAKIAWSRKDLWEEAGFLFFSCLLGFTVGVTMGLSREAAVSAVVPAVLTLIGALVGYLYSGAIAVVAVARFTIVVSAVVLTTFFFWGTFAGATARLSWDQYGRDFELYKLRYVSDLELHRRKYEAELQRISLIYQAQLEAYKATRLKATTTRSER